jgi:hypothetical protein
MSPVRQVNEEDAFVTLSAATLSTVRSEATFIMQSPPSAKCIASLERRFIRQKMMHNIQTTVIRNQPSGLKKYQADFTF